MSPPGDWGSAVFGNGNARVLIVEDSDMQRTKLADLVRLWGYDTETASDGLEALEKMPLFRPRVVISDLLIHAWEVSNCSKSCEAGFPA